MWLSVQAGHSVLCSCALLAQPVVHVHVRGSVAVLNFASLLSARVLYQVAYHIRVLLL